MALEFLFLLNCLNMLYLQVAIVLLSAKAEDSLEKSINNKKAFQ